MRNILTAVPSKKEKLPLSVTHPELAKEADGWDCSQFTSGSNQRVSWTCTLGHKYSAAIYSRALAATGCPFCGNKRVLPGFNDLATTHPQIAAEADGWDPTSILAGNNRRFNWICPKGHNYSSGCNSRAYGGSNCPVCANFKVLQGYNDLATTHPDIAREAYGWDPRTVIAGNTARRQWICELGHIFESSSNNRTSNKSTCTYCSNTKVLTGFNDLATSHPALAVEANNWDPKLVMAGNKISREWVCNLGHIYFASCKSRTTGKTGCPYCSNTKVLSGFNDLATTHPDLALEAVDWDPRTEIAGSGKQRTWRCSKGHSFQATLHDRSGKGSGCPLCAEWGFNPGKPGFLYFLEHTDWEMYQIGITNVPDDRIAKHSNKGWRLIEIRGPFDGLLARNLETAILRMLKANGADLSNAKIAGKFDGYSEAWSKSRFEVKSIRELMRLTEEFKKPEDSARAKSLES